MNRRVWAAIVAAVLALVGGTLLYLYARNADQRALAGLEPVNVLVVAKEIPRGTTAVQAAALTEVRQVPANAVVPGVVRSVAELPAGSVATTDLQVGEQVLASRFVDPASQDMSAVVDIPKGMEQLSLQLQPQRVIGAELKAGATVGVIASFKFEAPKTKDGAKDAAATTDNEIETTHMMLDKVLVTRVQGVTAVAADKDTGTSAEAPTDDVMVTLAVSAHDAERLVFAAEYGTVWLTLQGSNADPSTAELTTGANVFR